MVTDIVAPLEQEGTKSVLKSWLKQVGDQVRSNEPVVELETDKVAVEIAADCDGVLTEILVAPESEVEPGAVLGRISNESVASKPGTPSQPQTQSSPNSIESSATRGDARVPPGIRRMLAERGLEARDIPLSGSRLTREDVEAESARRTQTVADVIRIPHDSMRRRIAEHMVRSVQTAPHVTAMFEADLGAIIDHRKANKSAYEAGGVNLTFTAYFVAASARAMEAAPSVNGRWFDDRVEIYRDVNIGIGTALGDRGLVVPVVPRVQTLELFEIASTLQGLTERARSGTLSQADVRGGTFSISNHGTSGSLMAAPIIINQPQAAILGIGRLQKRAVVRERDGSDAVEVRPMVYITLTIDHRMLDGHQTNSWLTRFVEVLESWPGT